MSPGDMRKMIHAEVTRWADVARFAGIHLPALQARR
jgi:hypothetical protein